MGSVPSGIAQTRSSVGGAAAIVAVSAILGAALAGFAFSAKLVVGAILLVALLLLPLRALLGVAVVATFATRISLLSVGHIDLRPEHFVTCALVVRLLFKPALRLTRRQTQVLAALIAFLVLNIVSTVFQAPNPGRSVSILGWIALDIALFVALAGISRPHRDQMIHIGVISGMFAAVLAVVVVALSAFAGITIGVQFDNVYGGYAAYVFSYEANTLGSSIAIWAVVSALVQWPRRGVGQYTLQLLATAGIVATHTRAALIGYAGAMMLIAVWRRRLPVSALATIGMVLAFFFLIPGALPPVLQPVMTRFSHTLDFESGNGLLRVRNWKLGASDIKGSAYLLGLGTNSYGQRHVDTMARGSTTPGYLGNLPLQVFYDVGIFGVVLLIIVFMTVVRSTSPVTWVSLAFVYLVCGIATSIFWFSLTWILVALALNRGDASSSLSVRAPCSTNEALYQSEDIQASAR